MQPYAWSLVRWGSLGQVTDVVGCDVDLLCWGPARGSVVERLTEVSLPLHTHILSQLDWLALEKE
jgi:hypothetical protein